MKTFDIVLFALTIVSVSCSENVDKRSSNNEQEVSLNRGEIYPQGLDNRPNGYEDQYGYKLKTKKYYPPEPKENVQYMIIKRTRQAHIPKKYVTAHSSAEMTSYHNKQPMKYAYSVAHKPKTMPVKVVQQGSVKHIYLDMPDMFDDVPPKAVASKIPNNFDNAHQATSNAQYQYNSYNPGQYEQKQYRPFIQYMYTTPANINSAPAQGAVGHGFNQAASEIHQESVGHGYNTVSGGYRIAKTHEVNPQEYGQQLSHEFSNGFSNNAYPQAQHSSQAVDYSGYGSFQAPQYVPPHQNGFSHPQFPQFSADGKERYMYEIPDQYKSLFTNNAYTAAGANQFDQSQGFAPATNHAQPAASTQYEQHQGFVPSPSQYDQNQGFPANVPQNQQTYDYGKTARVSDLSGFDPNLLNIVNEVLSKEEGYSTSDGFKMVKSNDEKAVYMVGNPGIPLDAVPNLASYNSKQTEQAQSSTNIKYV